MKWNNGKERAKFEREQERLKNQYMQAGMPEEKIQAMRNLDEQFFNATRREAEHTQRLDLKMFDGETTDDGRNPLLAKFTDSLTVDLDLSGVSRYSWIEEIENESLAKALKSLPLNYLEILTMLVMDGMTQTEIAHERGVSQQYISQIFQKIKNIFIKTLVKKAFSSATTREV